MPSKQHEQWKRDLFDHLDRKLSGCITCELGEDRDSHSPANRVRHREPSQQILWTCEQMHPHSYDLLRGAGFAVMEQQQSAPTGGRCRPDLTIPDTHREPLTFIEIVRSNRPTNSLRVAEELGIPLFTILAPDRRSLVPGLTPARPWWDFDPSLPADVKIQMYLMEQVADELTRRNSDGNLTRSNLDMMIDDDGNLDFASFRGSPPDLEGPTFPRMGDKIVAELCSWGCDKAMEVLECQRFKDHQDSIVSMRHTLEQDLGRIILEAIGSARDEPARFVFPVGTEEVHVEMSLKPLNAHNGGENSIVLNLMKHLTKAAERVRGVRSCEATSNAIGTVPSTKGQTNA